MRGTIIKEMIIGQRDKKMIVKGKWFLLSTCIMMLTTGCHTDMWIQPKLKPLHEDNLFPNGQGSRPLPEGTVAVGRLEDDSHMYTGRVNGKLVKNFPIPITKKVLDNGQEKYHIFCSHCHGALGDGKGMITQRGLVLTRTPPTYHTDRLRDMPIGHFYDVITNGYGTMLGLAERVMPEDRWAIAAYIRALQKSQHTKVSDVSNDVMELITGNNDNN